MKKAFFLAATLVAMVGCNKTIIENPVSGYGYISLGVSADTEMVATKGIETEAVLDGYTITLINTDNKETIWSKVVGDINNDADWKVPAGNYKITVTNYSEKFYSGKGAVHVYGEVTVGVTAGQTASCTVNCEPINSMVSFSADESFTNVFQDYSITVVEGSLVEGTPEEGTRTVTMSVAATHTASDAAYFEPGTLTWVLTATPKLGNKESEYRKIFETIAGKWTQITFSSNNADGQIGVVTIIVDDSFDEKDAVHTEEIVNPFEDA